MQIASKRITADNWDEERGFQWWQFALRSTLIGNEICWETKQKLVYGIVLPGKWSRTVIKSQLRLGLIERKVPVKIGRTSTSTNRSSPFKALPNNETSTWEKLNPCKGERTVGDERMETDYITVQWTQLFRRFGDSRRVISASRDIKRPSSKWLLRKTGNGFNCTDSDCTKRQLKKRTPKDIVLGCCTHIKYTGRQ